MKTVQFEGKTFNFPDDFTDAEISTALAGETGAPNSSAATPSDAPPVASDLTPPGQQANDPFAGVGMSKDNGNITLTLPRPMETPSNPNDSTFQQVMNSLQNLPNPGAIMAESALKGITGLGRGLLTSPQDIIRGLASDNISNEDLFKNPILGLVKTIGDIGRSIPRIKGGSTAGDVGGGILQFGVPSATVAKGGTFLGKTIKGINDIVPGKGQALANLAGTSAADVIASDPTQNQSIVESVTGRKMSPIQSRVQTGFESGSIGSMANSLAAILRSIKVGLRPFTKKGLESQVAEKLQEFVQKPPSEVANDITKGLARNEVPGFKPTTGAITGDTGLLGFEKGAMRDPTLAARAKENKTALSLEVQNTLKSEGDPADIKAFAEQRDALIGKAGEDALRTAQRAQDVAQNEVDNLLASVPGSAGGRNQASKEIDKVAKEVLTQKTILKNKKFKAIDPQGVVETDVNDTLDLLKGFRPTSAGDLSGKKFLNSDIVETLRSFTEKPAVAADGVTPILGKDGAQLFTRRNPVFKEINDLRPSVSDAIEKARISGDGSQVLKLKQIRRFINKQADILAERGDQVGLRAKDAVSFFKNKFAPLFGEGVGKEFKKSVRRFKETPTSTAAQFLQLSNRTGGAEESAQQLSRIIDSFDIPSSGTSQIGKAKAIQAGRQAVQDFIVEDLGIALQGKNAKQSAPIVRQFQKANADNLNAFPQAAKQVEDFAKGLENGLNRVNQLGDEVISLQKALKETDKSEAAKAFRKVVKMDDPVRTLDGILSSPTGKTQFDKLFVATKKDPQARAGLKAAVSEALRKKIINNVKLIEGEVKPAKLNEILNDPVTKSIMGRLFKKSDIKALSEVRKRIIESSQVAGAVSNSGSIIRELTVESQKVANIFASIYGIAKGRGLFTLSKFVVNKFTGGSVDKRLNDIVAQSMTDPAYARMLLNKQVGDNSKEARRVIHYTINNVLTDQKDQ